MAPSYALDAMDVATEQATPVLEQEALRFVADAMAARIDRFPAVGLGEDLRLAAPTLTGGLLAVDGNVVHLCAFRLSRAVHGDTPDQVNRLARASVRRRGGAGLRAARRARGDAVHRLRSQEPGAGRNAADRALGRSFWGAA